MERREGIQHTYIVNRDAADPGQAIPRGWILWKRHCDLCDRLPFPLAYFLSALSYIVIFVTPPTSPRRVFPC